MGRDFKMYIAFQKKWANVPNPTLLLLYDTIDMRMYILGIIKDFPKALHL